MLVATRKKGDEGLIVRKSNLEHTCDPQVYVNQKRSSVPSRLLVPFVSEYLHSDPNPSIKGIEFI